MEREEIVEYLNRLAASKRSPVEHEETIAEILTAFDALREDADYWEDAFADGVRNEGGHVDPTDTIKALRSRLTLADALAKQVNDALRVCYEVNQTGDCAGCLLHIPCTWAFMEKPLREYQADV